jgi:hypothetical protein
MRQSRKMQDQRDCLIDNPYPDPIHFVETHASNSHMFCVTCELLRNNYRGDRT